MKNHRVFTVRFLRETNTKGARVSITELHNNKTYKKVISYNYDYDTARQAAENYLKALGLNLVGYGETNYGCVILSDSWADSEGFINILGEKEF